LSAKGLPNLWAPAERDWFQVPELPVLGSGKLDLKRVKDMALQVTSPARVGPPHSVPAPAISPTPAVP
jgi:acyl-[acyl-carrier-protein]-phospholipid O-acyltransferase/long-chain-fatty-acid--[acyl-carrier-protein] ligase